MLSLVDLGVVANDHRDYAPGPDGGTCDFVANICGLEKYQVDFLHTWIVGNVVDGAEIWVIWRIRIL
jgi:hypothetical protein